MIFKLFIILANIAKFIGQRFWPYFLVSFQSRLKLDELTIQAKNKTCSPSQKSTCY